MSSVEFVPVTSTYHLLPVHARPFVEAKAAKLGKRLAKLGCPAPTVTFGPRITVTERDDFGFDTSWQAFETVTVTGHEARHAGWTPVAALDHTLAADEALVSLFPAAIEAGTTVPDQFRFRGPVCDHCGIKIRRNATIVFAHDDGRWTQVGTSCVLEYIGVDPRCILMLAAPVITGDDEESFRQGREAGPTPEAFLAVAAEITLLWGFTPSSADWAKVSTKDAVLNWFHAKMADRVKDFPGMDLDRGKATAATIVSYLTDGPGATSTSDYFVSARLAARAEITNRKTHGLLASLPHVVGKALAEAADKATEAARPSEFIGTVGSKLSVEATITTAITVETAYGSSRRITGRTAAGDIVTTFGSGNTLWSVKVGEVVQFTGKVKAHEASDRYGNQTVLAMVKIAVPAEAAA